jgi:coenzyme F420-reducing hydrogenase delta subunit
MQIAVFFCQQIDPDQDRNRRSLEKELGQDIALYPVPCTGRIEVRHLLGAIEAGADKVYVLACPEDSCRYRQGSMRARKRVALVQRLVAEIGLPPECVELAVGTPPCSRQIDEIVSNLLRSYGDPG